MTTYVYFEGAAYDGYLAIPADLAAEIIKRWEECIYIEKKWTGTKQLSLAEPISERDINPILVTAENLADMQIQKSLLEKKNGKD